MSSTMVTSLTSASMYDPFLEKNTLLPLVNSLETDELDPLFLIVFAGPMNGRHPAYPVCLYIILPSNHLDQNMLRK